jgi:nucleotide-binding universal stress UspA family protein
MSATTQAVEHKLEEKFEQKIEQKKIGFKNVLVATDFSPASERAVEWALAIARRNGSQVTLVHALAPEVREFVPMDSPPELDRARIEAQRQMQKLADAAADKGIACQTRIERGRAGGVVASFIQREDADLIVVGTHGRGGVKKVVMGSVAEEVLRQAKCPVLTVGPHVAAVAKGLRHIVFATDFGPASIKAFPYALSLAEVYGAKLVMVHMFPMLPAIAATSYAPAVTSAQSLVEWQLQAKRESLKKLKKLIPPGAKLAAAPEFVVTTDFLPEGILTAAEQHDADLIVMGANRADSARITSHIPWSVTHHLIAEAECPVLTVRG